MLCYRIGGCTIKISTTELRIAIQSLVETEREKERYNLTLFNLNDKLLSIHEQCLEFQAVVKSGSPKKAGDKVNIHSILPLHIHKQIRIDFIHSVIIMENPLNPPSKKLYLLVVDHEPLPTKLQSLV